MAATTRKYAASAWAVVALILVTAIVFAVATRSKKAKFAAMTADEETVVSWGHYQAVAPDESTLYELELARDHATDEIYGWIMHGVGCNDPIGRLENVVLTGSPGALRFSAHLFGETVSFAGHVDADRIIGELQSSARATNQRGDVLPSKSRIVFERTARKYETPPQTREYWESTMEDALRCCGPTATAITPCR